MGCGSEGEGDGKGFRIGFLAADGGGAGLDHPLLLREYEMTRADLRVWEVDAGIDMGLTREFEVYHLPALFLFKDGRYLRPLQVEARPQALHRLVESVKDLPGEEQP